MGQIEMFLGTFFFGPLHLLITFTVEFASQSIYSFGRELVESGKSATRANFSVFSILALICWVCLTLGIPLGYQSTIKMSVHNNAVEQANLDWPTNALIFGDHKYEDRDDITVIWNFDSDTGLELSPLRPDLGFREQYNARVTKLIGLHGLPEYSVKPMIPDTDQIIQLLDATDLNSVDSFPHDLTENIHLMRRGSLSRWGSTSYNGSDSLSIVTPKIHTGSGGGNMPVYYKKSANIVFIRNGSNWVGAFLRDGRMIMSVSRSP